MFVRGSFASSKELMADLGPLAPRRQCIAIIIVSLYESEENMVTYLFLAHRVSTLLTGQKRQRQRCRSKRREMTEAQRRNNERAGGSAANRPGQDRAYASARTSRYRFLSVISRPFCISVTAHIHAYRLKPYASMSCSPSRIPMCTHTPVPIRK